MSIAQRLSRELVALDERDHSAAEQTALEITYAVSIALSDPAKFFFVMTQIAGQVTDAQLKQYLQISMALGLEQ